VFLSILKDSKEIYQKIYFETLPYVIRFAGEEEERMETSELVAGGKNLLVTKDNRDQYIERYINWLVIGRAEPQLNAFRKGYIIIHLIHSRFYSVYPRNLLKGMKVNGIEAQVIGRPKLDVNDWQGYSEPIGFLRDDKPVTEFWDWVRTLSEINKRKLLGYTTGYVPPSNPSDHVGHQSVDS
jgi:hypothetical protein